MTGRFFDSRSKKARLRMTGRFFESRSRKAGLRMTIYIGYLAVKIADNFTLSKLGGGGFFPNVKFENFTKLKPIKTQQNTGFNVNFTIFACCFKIVYYFTLSCILFYIVF